MRQRCYGRFRVTSAAGDVTLISNDVALSHPDTGAPVARELLLVGDRLAAFEGYGRLVAEHGWREFRVARRCIAAYEFAPDGSVAILQF